VQTLPVVIIFDTKITEKFHKQKLSGASAFGKTLNTEIICFSLKCCATAVVATPRHRWLTGCVLQVEQYAVEFVQHQMEPPFTLSASDAEQV